MTKKLLITCFEVPGYGGAATESYELFARMQRERYDVHYVNIISREDNSYFQYVFGEHYGNPDRLEGVYNCVLKNHLFRAHAELAGLLDEISPDLILGIGWIAALVMKQANDKIPLIYFTTGSAEAKTHIVKGRTKDVLTLCESLRRIDCRPTLYHELERKIMPKADLIITHSDLIHFLTQRFFPSLNGQIYPEVVWCAEWIYEPVLKFRDLQRPFEQRDIDLLFIASNWNRPEKNYNLVKRIVSSCRDLNIHIAGAIEKKVPGVTYHDLVAQREPLFELLGRAKTVVSPSLYDPAPGVLFEASAMDCNIVASKNCGNWQICHDQLLVDPVTLENFTEKIRLSMTKKFDDDIDFFLKSQSYLTLLEIISLF